MSTQKAHRTSWLESRKIFFRYRGYTNSWIVKDSTLDGIPVGVGDNIALLNSAGQSRKLSGEIVKFVVEKGGWADFIMISRN